MTGLDIKVIRSVNKLDNKIGILRQNIANNCKIIREFAPQKAQFYAKLANDNYGVRELQDIATDAEMYILDHKIKTAKRPALRNGSEGSYYSQTVRPY
ncbi:hypothetical protein [Listeria fleischmannii]|uniref:hypothetical protein n=1 Tax=Listeria fleischmannii TaxID=1069827 RepID=UPI001F49AA03|nr:hypothetical protein [Listeria fleischmannii]